MISSSSATVAEALNDNSFIETKTTRKIQTIDWPKDENVQVSSITFRLYTSLVKPEDIKHHIKRKFGNIQTVRKAVTVKMADIRWFMEDQKQFLKFCELLNNTNSDSIFGTEIVNKVLHEFWDGCYKKLFWFGFIPYVIGLISFLSLVHKVFS